MDSKPVSRNLVLDGFSLNPPSITGLILDMNPPSITGLEPIGQSTKYYGLLAASQSTKYYGLCWYFDRFWLNFAFAIQDHVGSAV